jgi:hypothetical protein
MGSRSGGRVLAEHAEEPASVEAATEARHERTMASLEASRERLEASRELLRESRERLTRSRAVLAGLEPVAKDVPKR